MDMNHKSIHQLRNSFIDELMQNNMEFSDKLLNQLQTQINYILGTELVAIFLYNEWKEEYELVTEAPIHQDTFNRYLLSSIDQELFPSTVISIGEDHLFDPPLSLPSYLIPLDKFGNVQGFILVAFTEEIEISDFQQHFDRIAKELSFLFRYIDGFNKVSEKANKYELLYRLSTKLYSSIDTKNVLTDVFDTLSEVYSHFDYKLLLSQDYQEDWKLPIDQLNYNENSVNEASVQAFLTGDIKLENFSKTTRLNAPLRGKQGVYGVLQVYVPNPCLLSDGDIKFFTLIASTTGKAIENATLFQQSKQLITDLQLINETSHTLNSNLKLVEMTSIIKKQIKDSFGAEEIGFFLFPEDGHTDAVEGSTDYFLSSESSSFVEFIIPILKKEKDSMFISDFTKKYPDLNFSYQSVMAIPMLQLDHVTGAIIVMRRQANSFTFESFKLIQSLVQHSSLAIANSILRERLEKLVITDYLTKLYSRSYLDERLKRHIKTDEQGVFLLIDIDDFKKVNDMYGHDTGDRLLIQVANIIKINLGKEEFAARWGGEELAIYLPQANVSRAMELGQQLVRQVEAHTTPLVTISVGLSYWNKERPVKPQQLFDETDQALYKAKRLGKNRVVKAK